MWSYIFVNITCNYYFFSVVIIITFLFSDDLDIRNSVQSSINEPDHAAGASSNHTGNRESAR